MNIDSQHIVATISLSPCSIKSQFSVGALPVPQEHPGFITYPNHDEIYAFNNQLIGVLNYGGMSIHENTSTTQNNDTKQPGSFLLIDIQKNLIVKQVPLFGEIYPTWYPKQKSLFIASRTINGKLTLSCDDTEWSGEAVFVRVNDQGLNLQYTPLWFDYQYDETQDRVDYLTFTELQSFDFKDNSKTSINVGRNTYTIRESILVMTSPDLLHIVGDGKLATCTNLRNGKIRIVDRVNQKVIAKLKGQPLKDEMLLNKDGKTLITTNSDQSKFYVMQFKSVQVYNNEFKLVGTIDLPENAVGMYQLNLNGLKTIVVTNHNIYRIDEDKLVLMVKLTDRIINVYFLKNGENFNILANNEWLCFNPVTGTIRSLKTYLKSADFYLQIYTGHLTERKIKLKPA